MWQTNAYMNYERMLTPDEIETLVMEKYPVTEKEKTCMQEWLNNQRLRDIYRKELRANGAN